MQRAQSLDKPSRSHSDSASDEEQQDLSVLASYC